MAISDKVIGERIQSWRSRRGMSQAELAERIDGMTQPKISQVERGDRRLTTPELADAAYALQVDPLDLLESTPIAEGLVAAARGGNVAQSQKGVDLAIEILRTWDLVERDGFTVDVGARHELSSGPLEPNFIEEGRSAAEELRRYLELGSEPIEDLADVARRVGLVVAYRPFPQTEGHGFDGVCVCSRGKSVAVINTHDKFRGRQRFTLAHEIAHWMFGDVGDQPHIDINVTDGSSYGESRANSFAANLLIPDSVVVNVMSDDQAVRVAYEYGGSIQLMAYRVLNTNGDREMCDRLLEASRYKMSRDLDLIDKYVKDRDAAGRSGLTSAYESAVRDALEAGAVSARRVQPILPPV